MEVEILGKHENKLLQRTEVRFQLMHGKEKTPQRDAVREALAKALGANKDVVVVDELHSEFGRAVTTGYAKVYAAVDHAKKLEPRHILLRNKFPGVEKKAKAAAPAKAPSKKKGA